MNFTEHHDPMNDSTHLDASDFTDDFADKDTCDNNVGHLEGGE